VGVALGARSESDAVRLHPLVCRGVGKSRQRKTGEVHDAAEEGVLRGLIKSLWESVKGDPVFMRRLNGWLTMFWIAMIPVSFELGWLKSVTYVSALSLWALVSGHWSTWQSARVEVTQQREKQEQVDNPVEERVVERIVAETTVEEAE
jgi:hypothetical protein